MPGLKLLLVPPATPGSSAVAFDGCLTLPDRTETAGSRFPAPSETRGSARASVAVSPLGGGALVVHELDHNCCSQADVTSALKGRTVTVTEALVGPMCRCRCRSTVRIAVGLPPGEYTLKVVTDDNGNRRNAYEESLTVR